MASETPANAINFIKEGQNEPERPHTKHQASAAATAAKKPKQPEDPEHTRLANEWAAYYIDVLEAYKTNIWSRVNNNPILASMKPVCESEPLREKCREVLLRRLIMLDYAYCFECKSIFHNYKQILMHVKVEHKKPDAPLQLQRDVNAIMKQICKPWLKKWKAEDNHVKEVIEKHSHIDLASPVLRPFLGFVQDIFIVYGKAVFDYGDYTDSFSLGQMIAKRIPRLKMEEYDVVSKIMSKLHEHIGDNMTRCFECKLVTGNRAEYYEHMRTFDHIKKTNGMDLITLVVNMYKKDFKRVDQVK